MQSARYHLPISKKILMARQFFVRVPNTELYEKSVEPFSSRYTRTDGQSDFN
jgi:hypothetical protein